MRKITINSLPISFYFTTSREDFKKTVGVDSNGSIGLCSINYDTLTIWVGIFNGDIGTFNHELFHAIVFLNQMIGSNINLETNELNAYLFGDITRKCHKIFMADKK